jgi:hypothetical protein
VLGGAHIDGVSPRQQPGRRGHFAVPRGRCRGWVGAGRAVWAAPRLRSGGRRTRSRSRTRRDGDRLAILVLLGPKAANEDGDAALTFADLAAELLLLR